MFFVYLGAAAVLFGVGVLVRSRRRRDPDYTPDRRARDRENMRSLNRSYDVGLVIAGVILAAFLVVAIARAVFS
jgi:hypothetical protein